MDKTEEREVLRRAELLAQITPTPHSTSQAINHVREVLTWNQHRSHSHRIWRFAMRGAIAATLLIGFGTLFAILGNKDVRAEELLEEVIAANQAFQSWVHVVLHKDAIPPTETYFNTVDGTHAIVSHGTGRLRVKYRVPTTGEWLEYDAESGEITAKQLSQREADSLGHKWSNMPVLPAAIFERYKRVTGRNPSQVKWTMEDGFERFDITFCDEFEQAETIMDDNGSLARIPMRMTMWADPTSKLIRKVQALTVSREVGGQLSQGEMEWSYTYGEPAIRDIYDVGVPRDARIVDQRPKGEPE